MGLYELQFISELKKVDFNRFYSLLVIESNKIYPKRVGNHTSVPEI